MNFTPQSSGDAEIIAERIAPRLQHANSSVVLTTIKVILYLTNYMNKEDEISALCKKLSPPLGTSLRLFIPTQLPFYQNPRSCNLSHFGTLSSFWKKDQRSSKTILKCSSANTMIRFMSS